jgi:hypothetical protein
VEEFFRDLYKTVYQNHHNKKISIHYNNCNKKVRATLLLFNLQEFSRDVYNTVNQNHHNKKIVSTTTTATKRLEIP